jgi:endoglucanase
MIRGALRHSAALIVLLALLISGGAARSHAEAGPISLKRGVSIHEWLNWAPLAPAGDYKWPPYQDLKDWGSVRDFEKIKAMGFDFVRLSVDPGPLLAADGDRLTEALARLERDVRSVLGAGLKVILDLHPVSQVPAWSAKALEVPADQPLAVRYKAVVAAAATMLARLGTDRTALELMNEPQFYPCDGAGGQEWETVLTRLVHAARRAAPDLTLIVSGACGGNIKGLVQLDPARLGDDRLLYSFHFYEPLDFTHQGVAEAHDVQGAPWPVDAQTIAGALTQSERLLKRDKSLAPSERAGRLASVRQYLDGYAAEGWNEDRLKARFGALRAWAEQHGVSGSQLLLGEFGVMAAKDDGGGAFDADRFRWLDAVRKEADALGAAWAYWEYSNPSGMSLTSPDASRRADPVALKALGLAAETAELPVGN